MTGFTPANGWVGDWSRRRARLSPETVGLVDSTTGRRFTYRTLDERANRTARLLRRHDVAHGDRVVTLSRNRPELVDLFFATGKLGAVLAPLSHRLAAPTLAELIDDASPAIAVVERPFLELARQAVAHEACDAAPILLVVEPDAETEQTNGETSRANAETEQTNDETEQANDETSRANAETEQTNDETEQANAETERASNETERANGADGRWRERLPTATSPVERPPVEMDDPHLLLHTGGSTGTPKQTVISHRALVWNSFNTITAWGLRPTDTTPMTFPMFHTGGWNVITLPLFHLGGTVVIAREVDPGGVLQTIDTQAATVLVAVPAVLRAMTNHEQWNDVSLDSLRFVKSGGGPARSSVMETWWDRGVELSQGYGLTECGPNNFAMPTDWSHEKADAVGVPAMHVDARIVDENGDPEPAGEIGELELSGPHAADRYLDAPDETHTTFGPTETPQWVSTGDLARVDADGYYHIEGRKKNMFTSGGENVYPPEVEDAITDHPDVSAAVVIGVPDDQWGTVGKAVVVGDESLTLESLRAFLDDRLARFKHPRALAVTDELPTAGPSKLDREAVKTKFSREE